MIRQVLPLLLLLCLAGQAAATVQLNETHGSTWITWSWNVTELEANQTLLGRYDGAEVVNLSATSTHPLVSSYRVTGLDSAEPHTFDLIMMNTSTAPVTVEEVQSSTTATGQAQDTYLLFLGCSFVLCLVGMLTGRANRVLAMLLFVLAFLLAGYVAISMAAVNIALSLFGLLLCIVALVCLVFAFLEETKARAGWGEDE